MRASICAMRALIIASVSGFNVTVPASTSLTKLRTRSRPRSFVAASRPMRPSSTILSRRLNSGENAVAGRLCCCDSGIAASLRSEFRLQLLHGSRIVQGVLQDLLELVVALQAAPQVGELGAEVEQLLERGDVARDRIGREVVEALEGHVHGELAAAFLELVVDREVDTRLHVLEDRIEVVGRDLDKLPILEARQRLGGGSAQVRQHAHEEGELLGFDRTARLHVIADVYARRTDALEFLLCALSCHDRLRKNGVWTCASSGRKAWGAVRRSSSDTGRSMEGAR